MNVKLMTNVGLFTTTLLFASLLTACQPIQSGAVNQPSDVNAQPVASAGDVAESFRRMLGRQLHVDPSTIEVVSSEAAELDGCMSAPRANEICTMQAIPGYKLTFAINGEQYVIHTDQGGSQQRIFSAPEANVGETLLAWDGLFDNGETMEAMIGADGVAFGLSGDAPKIAGKFASPARMAVLQEWINKFATFDAETEFGSIRLVGSGSATPTAAEKAQIGSWAQIVAMEAAAGESLAGLHYEGPAEMGSPDTSKCAVLQLGTPIEAGIGACDGTMTNKDMGKAIYLEWESLRDRFAPFVYETESERITFEGMGGETNEAWQRAILAWARTRHAELASGKTSATIATVLHRNLGEDSNQKNACMHLTALSFGYTYAEVRMCESNEVVELKGSWLTSEELEPLDRWIYDITGTDPQAISEAANSEIDVWAQALWARIWAATSFMAPQ